MKVMLYGQKNLLLKCFLGKTTNIVIIKLLKVMTLPNDLITSNWNDILKV